MSLLGAYLIVSTLAALVCWFILPRFERQHLTRAVVCAVAGAFWPVVAAYLAWVVWLMWSSGR